MIQSSDRFLMALIVMGTASSLTSGNTGQHATQNTTDADAAEERTDLFEGDIVLDADERRAIFSTNLDEQAYIRDAVIQKDYRWPKNTMYYVMDANLTPLARARIREAIAHISQETSGCIKIEPRTGQISYVRFVSEKGCFSRIGREPKNREQKISIGLGCERLGTVVHEILHAFGFYHEQSRLDRDKYVQVHLENVTPGLEGNFHKYALGAASYLGAPYDYGSVLHYSRQAFSKNNKDTISPLDPTAEIGQRRGLSTIDTWQLMKLYNCPVKPLPTLEPLPTTAPVTVPEGDECSKHTILANTDRSASFYDRSVTNCDSKLAGWYRFRGAAGQQLSEQCLPKWHCGSHSTGWLNGTHPTVGDGVVERRVCFNWKDSCCKFKTNIRVRNCGAFYVYKLKPVPACNLRYCSVETKQKPVKPELDPITTPDSSICSFHADFKERDRNAAFPTSPLKAKCDKNLPKKWYRFSASAGDQMSESCVLRKRCGAHAPGWLSGTHPSVADGIVTRKVCFHWNGDCCRWKSQIRVRNCGSFYVYELVNTNHCNLRYCGAGEAPECHTYTLLSGADRRITSATSKNATKCDSGLKKGWYRFSGNAGDQMPGSCVPEKHCGAGAPGWLDGQHPTTGEGVVTRQVCYHQGGNCCRWKNDVRVRNCGKFFVYELEKPPSCNLRYCGGRPECSSYKLLDQADRSVSSSSKTSASCDRSLNGDWYRFSDAAGKQMSQSCPPVRHCGTHATGWLNGTHPVIGDGVVTRQVCFHWKKGCCQWKRDIRVLNCGEFYVYQLQKPPVCNSRYCGGSIAPQCSSYTLLTEASRKASYSNEKSPKCDKDMKKRWYRFAESAGGKMPESCVPRKRCGTHAPGWLDGKHPTISEGLVTRKVCFNWGQKCCRWTRDIRVLNCGTFFVYELEKPPVCNARYCGQGDKAS